MNEGRNAKLRITAPGRLWLLAAISLGVTGVVKNINLIILISYFLFALFIVNWWLTRRSLRGVVLRRLPPPPAFATEWFAWPVEIENTSANSIDDYSIEDFPNGSLHVWPGPRLEPGETTRFAKAVATPKRGTYILPPCTAVCSSPFGLIEMRLTGSGAHTAWIYPRRGVIHLERLQGELRAGGRGRERRRTTVRQIAEGTDVHGLRPFRTGDSPRWIHWRTTARIGRLMVREFDRSSAPGLIVAVDPKWTADDATGHRFEAALEFVATLVWTWTVATEARLTLILPTPFGEEVFDITQRAHAHEALKRLAEVSKEDMPVSGGRTKHKLPDHAPLLWIGYGTAAPGGERMVLAIDPTKSMDYYQTPELAVSQ